MVITNGTDKDTLNAIKYWQNKGLKIDSIIYRIYQVDKEYIFEFNPYNPENDFIVNTNLTWSKTNYREMLDQEKAAAYSDRKQGITNIRRGDTVFLYHTGVGVVAYGKAQGKYETADIGDAKDEEYFVPLKFDWKFDPDVDSGKAVRAWQINNKLNSRYAFRQTVFAIPEEMAEVIKKLIDERK